MQFVYPSFLFALGAVAVPILIHLFNFRRYKKIIFSDIRFLRQVQEETKSRQRLKEWLILLARILTISLLVLAFAQPFIPQSETGLLSVQPAVSIYLDNSFSMGNEGKQGVLLETAKNKARAIVNAYGNDKKFQLLTNDFEPWEQRLIAKNDALHKIDEIKLSSSSKLLSTVIDRQKQALGNISQKNFSIYLLSDFQKNFYDLENFPYDSSLSIHFIPVQSNLQHNVFIDSAWLVSPVVQVNTPVQLKVRIRNAGNENAENTAVTLKINGIQKSMINLNCAGQSFTDADVPFTLNTPGWNRGELSLIDYPVTFDDKLFFTLCTSSVDEVLCINSGNENRFIKKLFENDPSFLLVNCGENKIDYSSFGKQKLIILNEPNSLSSGLSAELKKYLETGGTVLVIPPVKMISPDLNNFLSEVNCIHLGNLVKQKLKADHINIHEEIFKDVFQKVSSNMDLPTVNQYYEPVKSAATRGVSLMQLNNGMPFIFQSVLNKGKLILLTSPLNEEWTNLPQHSVFVPFMIKLGMGISGTPDLFYSINRDNWISSNLERTGIDKVARITGNDADLLADLKTTDGKTKVYIGNRLKKAGVYKLDMSASPTGSDSALTGNQELFALNYSRDESDLKSLDENVLSKIKHASVLKEEPAQLSNIIRHELSGTQLWRVCLLLALLFILIEIFLLKFV
ncbi:MAG: BatA domain-containing protein [Bacteroidia bacterium]